MVTLSERSPVHIIAVGASAGGLEAIQDFLSHLPDLSNSAIVIAQHLSPTHKSMLVQLLTRQTSWNVEEAANGATILPRMVYITPPDNDILVEGSQLRLRKPSSPVGPKPSVDVLFRSLVPEKNQIVIGIILSGTGSDGAAGIFKLKNEGGILLAQSPETAKYDGMPQAAIATGLVDLVLPPHLMGEEIRYILENNGEIRKPENISLPVNKGKDSTMGKVFTLLGRRTGTDFSNYKSATIARRLAKRLNVLGIKSLEEYLEYIEKDPQEIDEMFETILIGVTRFFRDEEAFQSLEMILSSMVQERSPREGIRVWVPGCSTGEEAYSIAIILYRLLRNRREVMDIQIFATDIDEKAIAIARKGIYSLSSIEHLNPEIQNEFFIHRGNGFELLKVVRSMVLFSKHDVIQNPPFLKLDLISCRNLLIYFNSSLQQHIIPLFHYSLKPGGYLFLGKSETIGQFSDLFSTVDGKNKIYQKKRGSSIHSVKFSIYKPSKTILPARTDYPFAKIEKDIHSYSISELVKETFYNTFEHPYVVVDGEYNIQEVHGDVRLFLSLVPGSIQVNIVKMVNQELQIELRSVLSKAAKERVPVRSSIKKFELFGGMHFVRVSVKPLLFPNSERELFVVIFEKLEIEEFLNKNSTSSGEELIHARIQELEQELAATKEHLQTYIEELETTNEELQSLNEELQSTNEELQSSNEELETSNEELQSTNEEIQIAYAELKITHEELERKEKEIIDKQANIEALLNNNQQSIVLLDTSYRIITFNNTAQELFYLLRKLELSIGAAFIDYLPKGHVETFLYEFGQATGGKPVRTEKSMETASGEVMHFILNYTPVITEGKSIKKVSLAFMDITDLKQAISQVGFKDRLINSVFHTMPTGLCITDKDGYFFDVNQKYCDIYGYKKEELLGKHFTIVVPDQWKDYMKNLHDKFISGEKELPEEFKVLTKEGKLKIISFSANLLIQQDGSRFKVTAVLEKS